MTADSLALHAALLAALNAYRADCEVPPGETLLVTPTTRLPSFCADWL